MLKKKLQLNRKLDRRTTLNINASWGTEMKKKKKPFKDWIENMQNLEVVMYNIA